METTFKRPPEGQTNEILDREQFYLSYQPSPTGNRGPIGWFAVALTGDERLLNKKPETALCVYHPDGREWLILYGDFRKDYEGILASGGGLAECIAFYLTQKDEHKCPWSTERER